MDARYLSVAPGIQGDGRVVPPAVVGAGCRVATGAHVGSLAVLGPDVEVGEDAVVERAVVLEGSRVGPRCTLRDCIVGPGVTIDAGTRVDGGAVLGAGVRLGSDNVVSAGARIFPGVELPDGAIRF